MPTTSAKMKGCVHSLGVEGNGMLGMLPLIRDGDTQHLGSHRRLGLSIYVLYDKCHPTNFERRRTQNERLQAAHRKVWTSSPRLELLLFSPCHGPTISPFCPDSRLISLCSAKSTDILGLTQESDAVALSPYTHTNTSTDTLRLRVTAPNLNMLAISAWETM